MKKKTKRIAGLALSLLLLVGIAMTGATAYDYYRAATPYPDYDIAKRHDDTLRILLIGDSWAFYHSEHPCRLSMQIERQLCRPVTISSIGFCGARSKTIYERMFSDGEVSHKPGLLQSPDYCLVMAGVNDCYTKTGSTAYRENMELIIKFLLGHQIRPIVFDIPDFDIYGAYRRQTFSKKCLRKLSMAVTGDCVNCIPAYREALANLILEHQWEDSLIHIKSTDWNDRPELYKSDCLHLNDTGYQVLDSCLSAIILHDLGL